ncbi:PREDICTED: uncharacterized protein LOC106810140 [Priapulus caudatus]|uniref:Uncharacterized protein LOC106810140 n=1 Tax=Priapulus caudatus TaxID=37621 RepID=A0ABM1E9N6_PRICU|nr:PREDICTED: uncharacterized protein LOC106810140 [Priapulus caudatus]
MTVDEEVFAFDATANAEEEMDLGPGLYEEEEEQQSPATSKAQMFQGNVYKDTDVMLDADKAITFIEPVLFVIRKAYGTICGLHRRDGVLVQTSVDSASCQLEVQR